MTEPDTGSGNPEADGANRTPLEVALRDAGPVEPAQPVPILESLRDENWSVGEELRLLAARVHESHRERGLSCLAVTSALPGEGKSTISAGLAGALAREPGRRVLLVEADLRRPSLSRLLHLPPCVGLSDYLNGGPPELAFRRVEPWGFSIVIAGVERIERPEALASARMSSVLRVARERYDFVLLDAPPLVPVADSVLIQDMVDRFVIVVRSRQTPRAAIDEALGKLRPDAVLGLVLNDHHVYRDSYRSYAYQGYGVPPPSPESGHAPARRFTRPKARGGRRPRNDAP